MNSTGPLSAGLMKPGVSEVPPFVVADQDSVACAAFYPTGADPTAGAADIYVLVQGV